MINFFMSKKEVNGFSNGNPYNGEMWYATIIIFGFIFNLGFGKIKMENQNDNEN